MRPSLFNYYYQITYYYLQVLAKKPKNFTKSAISPFALFVQFRSLKKHHALHFSIFSLQILNTASQLNLAANVQAEFLNFDFGAIFNTFFGHNSAIFWPIGWHFFVRTQETIISRLLARNKCYAAQFLISIFWAATSAPKGRGLQNPTKKFAHLGVLFGHLLSQNHVSKVSDLGPPPLMCYIALLMTKNIKMDKTNFFLNLPQFFFWYKNQKSQ